MGGSDEAIAVTRDSLRSLLRDIDQIIVVCGADGTISLAAGAVDLILGYDPHLVEGRNIFEFLRPEAHESVLESLIRWTDRAGAPAGEVHDLRALDGSWVPVRYDVVTGPDVEAFGEFVLTLRPAATDSPERRVLLERVLNEDRLVRLASAFLRYSVDDFDGCVDEALSELAALDWVTRVSIWITDTSAGTSPELVHARRRAQWSAKVGAPAAPLPERARMDASPVLRRLRDLEEVHVRSVAHLPDDWADERRWLEAAGVRSMMAIPMVIQEQFAGFIMAEVTLDEIGFDVTMISTLRSAAAIFASAFRRHEVERELLTRARTDELTGLCNRWAFHQELSDAIEDTANGVSRGVVVAVLNLDRFTMINSALGHEAGDRLLIDSARRMRHALEEPALLARAQSDEFLVLFRDVADIDEAVASVQAVQTSITPPFDAGGEFVTLSASAGLAPLFSGDVTGDIDVATDGGELTRRAEVAMRHARQRGGGRIEVDDRERRGRVAGRLRRETQLRAGISGADILVHYQPEWDLNDRTVIGVEALARWAHPDDGLVAAGDFIPLAEECGLIALVGETVFRTACATVAEHMVGRDDLLFELKVNISTHQLDDALPALVEQVLAESRLAPNRLCFELTESALLADPEGAVAILHALRDLGVGLAIDDFGTGYSSMVYLKRLPVTLLKIDQSFVAGLPDEARDRAIVRASVQLARSLDIEVTAEGVETEAQIDALLDLGCTRAQGFLLGRPAAAPGVFDLLL